MLISKDNNIYFHSSFEISMTTRPNCARRCQKATMSNYVDFEAGVES